MYYHKHFLVFSYLQVLLLYVAIIIFAHYKTRKSNSFDIATSYTIITLVTLSTVMISIAVLIYSTVPRERLPIFSPRYREIRLLSDVPEVYYSGSQQNSSLEIYEESQEYEFEYNLPQDREGFVGFVFQVDPPEDLTWYEYVLVTLVFNDLEAACELFLRDQQGDIQYIRLDKPDSNARTLSSDTTFGRNERIVAIPLLNFTRVDIDTITEVGFHVHTNFTSGNHSFVVDEIDFVNELPVVTND